MFPEPRRHFRCWTIRIFILLGEKNKCRNLKCAVRARDLLWINVREDFFDAVWSIERNKPLRIHPPLRNNRMLFPLFDQGSSRLKTFCKPAAFIKMDFCRIITDRSKKNNASYVSIVSFSCRVKNRFLGTG